MIWRKNLNCLLLQQDVTSSFDVLELSNNPVKLQALVWAVERGFKQRSLTHLETLKVLFVEIHQIIITMFSVETQICSGQGELKLFLLHLRISITEISPGCREEPKHTDEVQEKQRTFKVTCSFWKTYEASDFFQIHQGAYFCLPPVWFPCFQPIISCQSNPLEPTDETKANLFHQHQQVL